MILRSAVSLASRPDQCQLHTLRQLTGLDAISTASVAAVLSLQDWYTGNATWKVQVLEDILGFYAAEHPEYANSRA